MAQPKLLLCFSLIPAVKKIPGRQLRVRLLVATCSSGAVRYVPGYQKEWQQILAHPPSGLS